RRRPGRASLVRGWPARRRILQVLQGRGVPPAVERDGCEPPGSSVPHPGRRLRQRPDRHPRGGCRGRDLQPVPPSYSLARAEPEQAARADAACRMPYVEDDFAWPLMSALAVCRCTSIAEAELPGPCRCGVVPGPIAVMGFCGTCASGSCGGQAWV